MTKGRLHSTLEYHPYAVLTMYTTCEPCWRAEGCRQRTVSDFFAGPNRMVAQRCRNYMDGIHKNADRLGYKNAAGDGDIWGHLYNPISYVSFGSMDNIAIVAADDFDFAVDVTSQISLPVKDLNLSFAPMVSGLHLAHKHERWLSDLDRLCCGPRKWDAHGLPRQPSLDDKPLVGITHYRLNGLAAVGPGLLFQEAIFRTIAETIGDTLNSLKPRHGLFTQADIDSFSCVLLDPQGSPDVATIMVCRNYSVIAAVILALRAVTFNEVYQHGRMVGNENRLLSAVKEFEFYDRIDQRHKKKNEYMGPLANNHLFAASCTTVGITHTAFLMDSESAAQKYSGVVSTSQAIYFGPEYQSACIRRLSDLTPLSSRVNDAVDTDGIWWVPFGSLDATEETIWSSEQVRTVELRYVVDQIKHLRGWQNPAKREPEPWFIAGLQTQLFAPAPATRDTHDPPCLNTTRTLMRIRAHLFEDVKLAAKFKKKSADSGRELTEGERQKLRSKYGSSLSLDVLRKAIKDLRIPAPLSSAIVYLFIDYAKSLSDPDLFDNVLDLHEVFWAFHRVLTQEMVSKLSRRIQTVDAQQHLDVERQRLRFLSARDLDELTDIVNLLESALHNRIELPSPTGEWWHTPVDFRGEMNKLFNAADVPLKCGLSILRRILRREFCVPEETELFFPSHRMGELFAEKEDFQKIRSRVGGTSKLTYNSSAMTRRFLVGGREVNFISELCLNIIHLVNPAALYAHLHETGHMICDVLVSDGEEKSKWCPRLAQGGNECSKACCFRSSLHSHGPEEDPDAIAAERERVNELFSELFGFGLVFADYIDETQTEGTLHDKHSLLKDDNLRTYFRHYIAAFSLDPSGTGAGGNEVLCKLAEVASRGFLAFYPFARPPRTGEQGRELFEIYKNDNYEATEQDVQQALDVFRTCMEDVRLFHYEIDGFLKDPEARRCIELHFAQMFRDSYRPLCCIWHHVHRLLKGIFWDFKVRNPAAGVGTNPDPSDHEALLHDIYDGYKRGKPLIRLMYDDKRRNAKYPSSKPGGKPSRYRAEKAEKLAHLDAFFIVRHLLRFHLHEVFGTMDARCEAYHLIGVPPRGGVNEQLIDKFNNSLFSVSFKRRASYLKSRIAFIKTLWDLSTNIRGRTLRRILDSTYGRKPMD